MLTWLHRADGVQINPADAAMLGIEAGATISLSANQAQLILPAEITEDVPAGAVWASALHGGGAIQALQSSGAERLASVEIAAAD